MFNKDNMDYKSPYVDPYMYTNLNFMNEETSFNQYANINHYSNIPNNQLNMMQMPFMNFDINKNSQMPNHYMIQQMMMQQMMMMQMLMQQMSPINQIHQEELDEEEM